MNYDKFKAIAQSLDYKSWKHFGRFLESPWFCNNEKARLLFEALFPLHPEFTAEAATPEALFEVIFDAEEYKPAPLRHVFSDLTKLLESFLIQKHFESNQALRGQLLAEALHQRNLDKYFDQQVVKQRKLLEAHEHRDMVWYDHAARLEEEAYSFFASRDNRGSESRLQNLSELIDRQFLSRKLKYSCVLINRMNVLQGEFDTSFLESIEQYLAAHPYEDAPAIHIYYTILRTLREPTETEHYHQLKSLLARNLTNFSHEELRDMYAFLQNYCIRKANTGELTFLEELMQAYEVQLEAGILYHQGYLSQFDFKNIVTVAARTNRLHWAIDFVETQQENLRKEHRLNAYTYNLARLRFSLDEYREARRLLLSVEFTDVFYYLDSKTLLLKTYYELDDYEPLLSLAQSFRTYLHRNRQISDYQKTIYLAFIRFVLQLTRVKMGSQKSVKEINKSMEDEKQIADLSWLQKKAAELI